MVARRNEYKLHLGPNTAAPHCARVVMAHLLHKWGISELLEDAALIASELVSNAARLGEIFDLTLTFSGRTLRIEVSDGSDDKPVIKTEVGDGWSEEGRGLLVVEVLADVWGYEARIDGGKVVWAELSKR